MCPNMDFGQGVADDYLFAREVVRLLEPSIVHLNSVSGSAVIAVAAESGIPTICHVRNRPGVSYSDALSYSRAIVAVSQFIKSEVMQFGVPEDLIHVVYSAVNTGHFCRQAFNRQAVRTALEVSDEDKLILLVARVTPYKRHDLMISALPLIKSIVPSARVLAVGEAFGDEAYVERLRNQIDELGLRDVFTFCPFQVDVRPFFVAADAFVLCSDSEPLGRSVVEALAMETPVIVTDSGGPKELVQHNYTGLVASSGDEMSLAKCIVETLSDLEGSARRSRAGRAFVEGRLSDSAGALQMMGIYASLLAAQ